MFKGELKILHTRGGPFMAETTTIETVRSAEAVGLMNGHQATRRTGLTPYRLLKYVATGRVRTRAELGQPLRYVGADVEDLARELGR
jgi:hypothetical protein